MERYLDNCAHQLALKVAENVAHILKIEFLLFRLDPWSASKCLDNR